MIGPKKKKTNAKKERGKQGGGKGPHGENTEKHGRNTGGWRRFEKAKWQLIMAGFDCSYCLLALLLGERGFKCLAAPFKHLKL